MRGALGSSENSAVQGRLASSVQRTKLRDRRIRSSEKTVSKALEGDYREEHLFTLRQSLERYRFLTQQISDCDREIARRTKALAGRAEQGAAIPAASKKLKARKGNSAGWLESQRQEYFRLRRWRPRWVRIYRDSAVQRLLPVGLG
jgi:hypothetical protein